MRRHFEDRHLLREHDFAALDMFDFEYQPVGFKFFNIKPEVPGLEKLDKKLAWCQMLPEAQSGSAFYAEADNHECEPGVFLPGHAACDPIAGGGRIGPPFHIYPDERANRRVYDSLSLLAVGSVHSTAFAPLSRLAFDPDLLILTCDSMDQTERVLRAIQYDTGDVIESRMTYVMGCNWLFNYPVRQRQDQLRHDRRLLRHEDARTLSGRHAHRVDPMASPGPLPAQPARDAVVVSRSH